MFGIRSTTRSLRGSLRPLFRMRPGACMVRFARVVAPGVPHHVTQRGNARRFILESGAERSIYLDLLQQGLQRHGVELIGYCLMSNHIHLIALPRKQDALARSLKDTHGRFASYWNAVHRSSGHVWQGRYYSCPLDDGHLWEALRYSELNPVRAFLVSRAPDWPWSSAAVHCGAAAATSWLNMDLWGRRWTTDDWRAYLEATQDESSLLAIRDSTYSGRPLGSAEFTRALEKQTNRPLTPQKRGPKKRPEPANEQVLFSFDSF
jgi:putative transposase